MHIKGLDELKKALRALPDKLRRQALRNALAAGGRVVRDEAKALAPVLQKPIVRKATGKTLRKPGTLRDAIRVRTSKQARKAGNVGVFVNVQPPTKKSGKRGADSPDDPYYWRWLEFGRSGRGGRSGAGVRVSRVRGQNVAVRRRVKRAVGPIPAMRFLQRAAGKLPLALSKIEKSLGPAIHRMNRKNGTL